MDKAKIEDGLVCVGCASYAWNDEFSEPRCSLGKPIIDSMSVCQWKLEEEGGITQISLRNIEKLRSVHGSVRAIEHDNYSEEQCTNIIFADGHVHRATGFSCGYRGEGPHGLLTVMKDYLFRSDITIDHIASWSSGEKIGRRYLILRGGGGGNGQPFRIYNVGCVYVLEVW